jgi:hypothetical protein
MAGSTISSGNKTTRFQNEVRKEYVRGGKFGPFIGNTQDSIIQTNKNLKKTSIALITKLTGAGVSGSTQLSGNEEALSNYDFTCQPTYYRNGVLVDNEENELSEFDLFQEARPALMNWTMELKRDQIIQALGAVQAGGVYYNYGGSSGAYGSSAASVTNLDTWNTNNQDRVLYGAAKSNNTSGDHTASLANIDTSADKIDSGMASLARRMAKNASPIIRPYQMGGDQEFYVMFVGSFTMRDLRADTTIAAANRDARPRDVMKNPIFTAGDLFYDGIIFKEIEEIDKFIDGDSTGSPWDGVWGANASGDSLATAGATSNRVGVSFLCGAQAVAMGMGRMASFNRRKEDDYGHQNGVGVAMKHDIKKIFYNNKQHGMVTVFHSTAADS